MIQDQQLLHEFHELPPESQNELINFLRYLRQKQHVTPGPQTPQAETPEQRRERLQQAAEMIRQWQAEPLPEEEQAIWDKLNLEGIPPFSCGEPNLDDESQD